LKVNFDQDDVGCGQRLQAGGEVRSFADHFVLRRGTCEITDGRPPVPPEYLYNRIRVDKPAAKNRSALNTDTG